MGEDFNKTPTELRYGDETYAELTFNTPYTGHLPEQKNEIATSRIVLDAMGLPDKVGTQMELTFTTDTDTFTDTFTLCGHLGWGCCGVSSNNSIIQRIYGTGSSGHPRGNGRNNPTCGNRLY